MGCAMELERATWAKAWDEDGWSSKKVKRLWKKANWTTKEEAEEDNYSYDLIVSAREFLRVCAENGYRIYFSY